jgi:hypothetical protein
MKMLIPGNLYKLIDDIRFVDERFHKLYSEFEEIKIKKGIVVMFLETKQLGTMDSRYSDSVFLVSGKRMTPRSGGVEDRPEDYFEDVTPTEDQ